MHPYTIALIAFLSFLLICILLSCLQCLHCGSIPNFYSPLRNQHEYENDIELEYIPVRLSTICKDCNIPLEWF